MNIAQWVNKILRRKPKYYFVSDIDKYLQEFDKKHPQKSKSQVAEIKKYERIGRLRDKAHPKDKDSKIWEGF